jgi:imidazolonepropionase-like amidohydrolase
MTGDPSDPAGRERALAGQTVLVEGDRIVAVGPAGELEVPEGARVIDGRGRTLVPGLVDMHLHLPPDPPDPPDPSSAVEVGAGSRRTLSLLLAHGVTTARSLAGHPGHPEIRDRVARGELLGPTLYVAAPAIHVGNTQTAEAAREAVRKADADGYDLVKSHHLVDPEVWRAVQDEAAALGLPVSGHVSNSVGLERAMAAGMQIEHLDGFLAALLPDGPEAPDGSAAAELAAAWGQFPPPGVVDAIDRSKLPALAAAMAERGVWNTPTLSLFEKVTDVESDTAVYRDRPEMRWVPADVLDQWAGQRDQLVAAGVFGHLGEPFRELRREIVAALHRAGAPLLAGSDTSQGFHLAGPALHEEIAALAAAGLPPAAALRAATEAPARYLSGLPEEGSATGLPADFGRIEPGLRADLLLLSENPLEDVAATRAIEGVMLRGRWLDRAALDALLAKLESPATAGGSGNES